MFEFIVAICVLAYFGIKELTRKKPPKDSWFDWDAYWDDVGKISIQEQLEKKKNMEYWTTRPKPKDWWELPLDTIVDVERYEYDKGFLGEKYAEEKRQAGAYRYMKWDRKYLKLNQPKEKNDSKTSENPEKNSEN